jgi:hypothetical protein
MTGQSGTTRWGARTLVGRAAAVLVVLAVATVVLAFAIPAATALGGGDIAAGPKALGIIGVVLICVGVIWPRRGSRR